jgi:uncharacterized protein (DUF58 family)
MTKHYTASGLQLNVLLVSSLWVMIVGAPVVLISCVSVFWLIWALAVSEREVTKKNIYALRAHWETKSSARRGQWIDGTLVIHNSTSSTFNRLSLHARSPHGISDEIIVNIPALSTTALSCSFWADRVGRVTQWGLEFTATGHLHVLRFSREIQIPLSIEVNFASAPLVRKHKNASRQRFANAKLIPYQDEGEFQELREYHSADDPRRIAWRASAKRGQLLTRVYEAPIRRRISIAVDISWIMRERIYGQDRLNLALDLAAQMINMERESPIGLLLFDHRLIAALPPKINQQVNLLDALKYGGHVVHRDCTTFSPEELWATVGDLLAWEGWGGVRIPSNFESYHRSTYAHPLLDSYWPEGIMRVIRSQSITPLPKGVIGPLDPQANLDMLRRYCWSEQLPMTYTMARSQRDLDAGLRAITHYAQKHRLTELIVLSHSHRIQGTQSLKGLVQWAHKGGGLTWYEVGNTESSFPMTLAPLKRSCSIRTIPLEPQDPLALITPQSPHLTWCPF